MPNPICPIHKTEMRPSKYKEGDFYCGKKTEGGTYCKETVKQPIPSKGESVPAPMPTPPKEALPPVSHKDSNRGMIRAVALKGAVELVASGKAENQELLFVAERLETWLNRE